MQQQQSQMVKPAKIGNTPIKGWNWNMDGVKSPIKTPDKKMKVPKLLPKKSAPKKPSKTMPKHKSPKSPTYNQVQKSVAKTMGY